MNFNDYNFACLITSITMFVILISKFNDINVCYILVLGTIFSIIWRSMKLIQGEEKIETDENGNKNSNKYIYNPWFILDFTFAILAYICIFSCNQINKKFIILTFLVFLLAWVMQFMKINEYSRVVHTIGHVYVLIIFILTFYLNIV
jgi:hypothetical protein